MLQLNIYNADSKLIIAKIKSLTNKAAEELAKELYSNDEYGWAYSDNGLIDDGTWNWHKSIDENGNLI